jgi:hypothetical protein
MVCNSCNWRASNIESIPISETEAYGVMPSYYTTSAK